MRIGCLSTLFYLAIITIIITLVVKFLTFIVANVFWFVGAIIVGYIVFSIIDRK